MHALAPRQRPAEEGGSLVLRFGTAIGLAALAALACAAPAAVRLSAPFVTAATGARVWVALGAAALGPMVVAIVVLRSAAEGLRAFAGPGAALRAFGVALWLAAMLVALTTFGSVLRATTHHHALAGVTYAFGALALAVGSALVCARSIAILRAASPAVRSLVVGALGGVAAVALAWEGQRFVRAGAHDAASSAVAATVVDVFAFALSAYFASRRALVARRGLALVGPPIAVVVAALGISALREAPVRDAVSERAMAFAPAARLVVGN
jgi:hypothetical protein